MGSVRASGYERMSYYPYGEEKTSTADDREKFVTYTRDSVTQDYADQRYYAVGREGSIRRIHIEPAGVQSILGVGTGTRTCRAIR